MGSIALTVLTLTLGMFFIFVGQFKVTPKFFPDIHEDMVGDDAQGFAWLTDRSLSCICRDGSSDE